MDGHFNTLKLHTKSLGIYQLRDFTTMVGLRIGVPPAKTRRNMRLWWLPRGVDGYVEITGTTILTWQHRRRFVSRASSCELSDFWFCGKLWKIKKISFILHSPVLPYLLHPLLYLPQTLQGNSGRVPSPLGTGGAGGLVGLVGFVVARLTFVDTGTPELLMSEFAVVFALTRFGSGFIKLNIIKEGFNRSCELQNLFYIYI